MAAIRARTIAAILVASAALTLGVFAWQAAVSAQPADACHRNEAQATVFAEMDLPQANAVYDHFPMFGKAPILGIIKGPVHLIAFATPHHAVPIVPQVGQGVATGAIGPVDHVVCLVTQTGDEWYFGDVSYRGFRP